MKPIVLTRGNGGVARVVRKDVIGIAVFDVAECLAIGTSIEQCRLRSPVCDRGF